MRSSVPVGDTDPPHQSRRVGGAGIALAVGVLGILAAILLPFAPIVDQQTTVTWPRQGDSPQSTTAFFVPYAPASIHVEVPCATIKAGQDQDDATTVVASHMPGHANKGFALSTANDELLVLVGGRQVYRAPIAEGDCSATLDSNPSGTTLRVGDESLALPADRVQRVVAFATDLSGEQAGDLRVRAQTSNWFENSPTTAKIALLTTQLVLAAAALTLLAFADRRRRRAHTPAPPDESPLPRSGWRRGLRGLLDVGTLAVFGVWAVLGPRSPDDSFTEGIVRNARHTGAFTNYYRWQNSGEDPFTLVLRLVQPLVANGADPLLLRVPSVLAGFGVWLLLSRGALPVLLPAHARRLWVDAVLAISVLVWWLPFNLGIRPEPFVALGVTAVLTCALRASAREDGAGLLWLGVAGLATGLTVAVNPVGVVAVAPLVVLAPRLWRTLRGPDTGEARPRFAAWGRLTLIACLAAVGVVVMFADQSWYAISKATQLHQFYGPNVAWFSEIRRYEYLLGFDEQGGLGRRLPVLLTLALAVCVVLLVARGARRLPNMRSCHVPVAAFLLSLALLWLTPSKWTHYFGALAGCGAAALTTAAVLMVIAAREWSRHRAVLLIGGAGTVAVVLAASLAFAGKNTWFLYSHFGVPHDDGPFPVLNTPLPWLVVVGVVVAAPLVRRRAETASPSGMLVRAPAIVSSTAAAIGVVIMLVSFSLAPSRQAGSYSEGAQGVNELTGKDTCGLLDHVVTTRDVEDGVLDAARGEAALTGFTSDGGYPSDSEPPDPAGSGGSTYLWGSQAGGAISTGTLTSQWFSLPELGTNRELAVSVAGRTGDGNRLSLEFARSADDPARPVGERVLDDAYKDSDERPTYPRDRVVEDKPQDHPDWRSLHVDATAVPPDADLVRVRATDATTDAGGWIAVTGPRIRQLTPVRSLLNGRDPIYVDWSMIWAAPCIRNLPRVTQGLVQAPTALLTPPSDLGFDGEAAFVDAIGGSFYAVDEVGQKTTLPTRLRGTENKPEYADWGDAVLVNYPIQRDAYDTDTTSARRWGWEGDYTPVTDTPRRNQ